MDALILGFGAILGMALMVVLFFVYENRSKNKASSKSERIIQKAEQSKNKMLQDAKSESWSVLQQAKKESQEILQKAEKTEGRIRDREEQIIDREKKIEKKLDKIEEKQTEMFEYEETLKNKEEQLNTKKEELNGKLAELAKLSEEEARDLYLQQIKERYESDIVWLVEKYKKKIEETKKEEAKEIILKSIQQYAWDVTSEVTTTLIQIPSDDIKWKLIGKEWRNITTFEKVAWVSLIIDDTPDTVFISAFDLYRRYVAKKSLEKLIEDGRIQPARIEEIVKATEEEADVLLKDLWNKVIEELWITWVPDEIIPIVWKLRFRTSYWQNILKHSKEVAVIAWAIAQELGVDSNLVKKGWLLHDIGKALDHDIEWTHPEIGAKLWKKYGLEKEVIDIIENHHGEQFSISIYSAIVQVADAISSVRPWARREAIEEYLKRVWEMEALVQSFSWVTKAYAISAWREVRVFVNADTISDVDANDMAKNIADKIQEELSYPGEVKVNLIREMRVIEYAK